MSRLRARLAKLIEAEFRAAFKMNVTVDPARLYPATGFYRTDSRADCYRWEGVGQWHIEGGSPGGLSINIDSWVTMTELVRSGGVVIVRDRATQFEVEAASYPQAKTDSNSGT